MRKFDGLLFLAVGLLTTLWCLSTAREIGPTFDEPFYLESGLEFWREGKPGKLLKAGTMPLPVFVQTLPLAVSEWVTQRPWVVPDHFSEMLVIARAGTLLFWWVLLLYTLLLGQALGGLWAGRLALLLVALEPSLLAHAGLATTDLAVTAMLLVFVYHVRAGRELGWGYRVGLPLVLFALALLSKASSLTFAPLLLIGVEIERLSRNGTLAEIWQGSWRERWIRCWRACAPLRRDGVAIVGLGLILAVLFCGSNGEPLREIEKNLRNLSDSNPIKPVLASAARVPIWPNGLQALQFQIKHNLQGHPTYLLGYEHPRAIWFYFPVLLTMKLTLGVLLLLGLGILLPGQRMNLALGLALLLLLFSLNCRVQLGIRFMLPLLAFLMVGLGVRLVQILQGLSWPTRRVGLGFLALFLGWLTLNVSTAWPDPLRYVNDLWGGMDRGYRMVSDSNFDWGQGMPELARWQQDHQVPLTVWYFGTDPRYPDLIRYSTANDGLDSPKLQNRFLAVGATALHGSYTGSPLDRELKARLREMEPVARTRTFFIYDQEAP